MDDFSGQFLIGPTLPAEYTNVTKGPVVIEKYCQIGAGSVVFPDLSIGEGSVVGAMSLVKASLDAWGIYAGIPAVFKKERQKEILNYDVNKLLK
ncbi:dTDP-4-amino-4,6-dideoxy-D-glucose acyltransferase [anaerobic digester metagenome]